MFLTVRQVWFNPSATATATDGSWTKFTLTAPQTLDLVSLNNGTLGQFASQIKLAPGTYNQVRLILADSTDPLTTSAQTLGAASNDEVDYIDTMDLPHAVPLAIVNAAQGISLNSSFTVAAATTSSGFGITTTTSTSSAAGSIGGSTFSAPVSSTTSALIDFDASRDLVPISLSGQPAYVLNPHPHLYNEKDAGSIQGAVGLTNVSTLSPAALPDVQVSAESVSSDGSRHLIIKSTRVATDGSFILYPLSTASGAPGSYDLVIHGPTIQTVIIKSVPVTAGAPGTTAVLGTLALTSATPFGVNVNPSAPVAPTSSVIGFYQTLPLASEVPYLVEERAVDPISGVFATDQSLSGGSLQYGTFVSGGTISLTTTTPTQGAGTYSIGLINPAYGTAALGTAVSAPGGNTTALFSTAAPALPANTTANGFTGNVSVAHVGTYDSAELFLTYNGALVATAPLQAYLSGTPNTLTLNAVAPGGSATASDAAGVYNAEVWAWNSTNPTATLVRTPLASSIDLSQGNASAVTVNIP